MPSALRCNNEGMEDKQIVAVDRLVVRADAAPADAVEHWQRLEPEPLLGKCDKLNEINQWSQLAIGAWLKVNADERGYGSLTHLAERWGPKPKTLRSWKLTYMKTQGGYRQ